MESFSLFVNISDIGQQVKHFKTYDSVYLQYNDDGFLELFIIKTRWQSLSTRYKLDTCKISDIFYVDILKIVSQLQGSVFCYIIDYKHILNDFFPIVLSEIVVLYLPYELSISTETAYLTVPIKSDMHISSVAAKCEEMKFDCTLSGKEFRSLVRPYLVFLHREHDSVEVYLTNNKLITTQHLGDNGIYQCSQVITRLQPFEKRKALICNISVLANLHMPTKATIYMYIDETNESITFKYYVNTRMIVIVL